MASKKIDGACAICGHFRALTYEHIPPKAAFNNVPILEADVQGIIAAQTIEERDKVRKRQNRRGAGGYTLCAECNNNTGSWYTPAYAEWTKQAWRNVNFIPNEIQHPPFDIEPPRVIKQIAAMFASACAPDFCPNTPEFTRFVLNPAQTGLPPEIRFYAYYVHPDSSGSRQSGITANANLDTNRPITVYSEIAFPPLGYVMTINRSPSPDHRLVDITFMAESALNERRTVSLKLPGLEVHSFLPADFRKQAEIDAGYARTPTLPSPPAAP